MPIIHPPLDVQGTEKIADIEIEWLPLPYLNGLLPYGSQKPESQESRLLANAKPRSATV